MHLGIKKKKYFKFYIAAVLVMNLNNNEKSLGQISDKPMTRRIIPALLSTAQLPTIIAEGNASLLKMMDSFV